MKLPEAVLTDLDNSLINSDRHVSSADQRAIRCLKEEGVKFFVMTGRQQRFAKDVTSEIGFDYPVCSSNGMHIFDYLTSKTLYLYDTIDSSKVIDMVAYFEQKGFCYTVYTPEEGYFHRHSSAHQQHWVKQWQTWKKQHQFAFHYLEEIKSELHRTDVMMVYLTCSSEEEKTAFENRFNSHGDLSVFWSGEGCLDICPKGADKGMGARKLSELYGFSLANTVAMGDNYNDLAMLRVCGIPVAPANAEPTIRELAKFVTNDHNHSPLTAAMQELYPEFSEKYGLSVEVSYE